MLDERYLKKTDLMEKFLAAYTTIKKFLIIDFFKICDRESIQKSQNLKHKTFVNLED